MLNKYGMAVEFDVQIPAQKSGRGCLSKYKLILDDFIQSGHNTMRIVCGKSDAARNVRAAIKKHSNGTNVKVVVRGKDVYLIKDGIEMEEN